MDVLVRTSTRLPSHTASILHDHAAVWTATDTAETTTTLRLSNHIRRVLQGRVVFLLFRFFGFHARLIVWLLIWLIVDWLVQLRLEWIVGLLIGSVVGLWDIVCVWHLEWWQRRTKWGLFVYRFWISWLTMVTRFCRSGLFHFAEVCFSLELDFVEYSSMLERW